MNGICRLCLDSSIEYKSALIKDEILVKIKCLLTQISRKNNLPNQVCRACRDKIEDLYAFRHRTLSNQRLLLQHAAMGTEALNKFYTSLKKSENNFSPAKLENKDSFEIGEFHKEIILENKENVRENYDKINQGNKYNKTLIFKSDNIDIPSDFSSDDDVKLSSIKQAKETIATKTQKSETVKKLIQTNPKEKGSESNNTKINTIQRNTTQENIWKCLMCSNSFETKIILLKHYKLDHGSNDGNEILDNFSTITTTDGTKMYKCTRCTKIYEKKKGLGRHKISHMDRRPFHCNICGRTYKTASDILRHGRVHAHTTLACRRDRCLYRTVYVSALREHERRHRTEFKYKCGVCGKGFQVQTWFEQHQNVHTGKKPFVCDICRADFHMERYLTQHRTSVHPHSSTVMRHVCVHCGHTCNSRNTLNIHLKEHGIKANFLCDVCGKNVSSAENLKLHKKGHTGEKPHACSTCGKGFVRKCNLKLHIRVHTGEKPYACTECDKAFTQPSTLKIHSRYHTGDRPYSCGVCPRAFISRSRLNSHQKRCNYQSNARETQQLSSLHTIKPLYVRKCE